MFSAQIFKGTLEANYVSKRGLTVYVAVPMCTTIIVLICATAVRSVVVVCAKLTVFVSDLTSRR